MPGSWVKTVSTQQTWPAFFITFLLFLNPLLANDKDGDKNAKKPNILFILTDDHRWDALGCYGNTSIKTPHFDRLAIDGVRFDAFTIASPLCCPSRAALLSGLYPHQNGVIRNIDSPDLRPGTPTVATHLNAAGYVTGFVGKAHMGEDPTAWGFSDCPVVLAPGGVKTHENPLLLVNGVEKRVPGLITEIFTDAAIDFLDRHKNETWFLWLATTAPHLPYLHDPKHPYNIQEISPPPGWPSDQKFTAGDKRHDWAGYYSTISMLDREIGRVLAKLETLGLADDTLVLMIGDNGWMMGSHGHFGKQVWYEESVRVPALARWPGRIKPGTIVTSLAGSVDFLPTVLAAAGIETPAGLEGRSLLPALAGERPARAEVYSEVKRKKELGGGYWQMVKTERWKYVRLRHDEADLQKPGVEEYLYDLAADPHEMKNLSASPEDAGTLGDMRRRLEAWLAATPAPAR